MHILVQQNKPIHLDSKDKQILLELNLNARKSYKEISRAVRLSPDGTKYRIIRLQENNVLIGSRTVVAFERLGLTSYHLLLSIHPSDKKTETEIIKFLENRIEVNAIVQYLGKWNFELAMRTRTAQEMDDFRRDLLHEFPDIQEEQMVITLNIITGTALPKKIFSGIGTLQVQKIKNNVVTQYLLDDTDKKILTTISNDANMNISQIMQKTSLTRDQITYRIKKLQEDGIILDFKPVINYAALGYSMHAITLKFNNRDVRREKLLASYLQEHQNIIWAARTLGAFDIIIYILSKDTNEFHSTVTQLRTQFGDLIKNYEALIAYKVYKYTFPFL